MEEEKVLATLITDVYCNDEYAEKPEVAVIYIRQSDLDRIRELYKVCKDHELATASIYGECLWLDKRPLLTFDELGDKFMVIRDYNEEIAWASAEDDVEDEQSFGSIDTEMLDISPHGIYFRAYGKHSGTKFESVGYGLQLIETLLENPEPTPRREFYFAQDEEVPEFEDLPKYLNDDDAGIQMYAREMIKKGK
jgi:hypothetical protein